MTTQQKNTSSDAGIDRNTPLTEAAPRTRYAAIYARSATAHDQAAQSPLDWQLALCQQYCQAHGYTVAPHHIFQEIASGAHYRNRPGLHALYLAATLHEFEVVVIVSHDRLARNPLQVATVLETLDSMGMRVEFLHEPSDAHEQWLHVLQAFRVEYEHTRLKVKRHQAQRPKAALKLQPAEAALLHTLFEFVASGNELATLATLLARGKFPPFVPAPLPADSIPSLSLSDPAH